mgnify:CR=1 FL=1
MKAWLDFDCLGCRDAVCDRCDPDGLHDWFIEMEGGRLMERTALDLTVAGAMVRTRHIVSAINLSSVRRVAGPVTGFTPANP